MQLSAVSERLEVREDEQGLRVDVLVARRFPGIGRAAAKALVEAGEVRVDGRRSRKGDRVGVGQVVELAATPRSSREEASPDPELALVVRYEDADLLVVDKPAHVPSHPLEAGELGTIANALVARLPELAGLGFSPREPGLVHRLDVDTSGLLVAAKTKPAFDALVASLREGRWDKRYRALVDGNVRSRFPIDAAIANHPGDPRKVEVAGDPLEAARRKARTARTEVTPVESVRGATLVEAIAHKAVRHQVRAHLASVGHPLIGDVLYGGPADPELGRHFLHASRLTLPHPTSGQPVTIESPLPPELEDALTRRRG